MLISQFPNFPISNSLGIKKCNRVSTGDLLGRFGFEAGLHAQPDDSEEQEDHEAEHDGASPDVPLPRTIEAKSESPQFQVVPGSLFHFFRLLNIDSTRLPGVLSAPVLGPSRRGAESFRGPPAATPSGPPLSVPVGLIVEVSENAPKTPAALTILATAGGAGYAPVAPGTFGSAVGVALYAPLSVLSPPCFQS